MSEVKTKQDIAEIAGDVHHLSHVLADIIQELSAPKEMSRQEVTEAILRVAFSFTYQTDAYPEDITDEHITSASFEIMKMLDDMCEKDMERLSLISEPDSETQC